MKTIVFAAMLLVTAASSATSRPVLTTPAQDSFFKSLTDLCGHAFAGEILIDTNKSKSFTGKKLVMHVRKCTDTYIEIPFHVGDNASRTWVITRTGSGLQLKHDHRHEDGTSEDLTMYGGHTVDDGYAQVQSFPVDAPTKQMFVEQKIPGSNQNTWQMFVYDDEFTYRLIREGFEFRVDFDLTNPVKTPAAPWGYTDE